MTRGGHSESEKAKSHRAPACKAGCGWQLLKRCAARVAALIPARRDAGQAECCDRPAMATTEMPQADADVLATGAPPCPGVRRQRARWGIRTVLRAATTRMRAA